MKHRLFIAVNIPDQIRQEIITLQSRLEKMNLPVRWEEPEKLHLTINFLGQVEESVTMQVRKLMDQAASLSQPFTLRPTFLETMYKKHETSFVYLGPSGQVDELGMLHKTLAEGLNNLKFPQPNRYMPHITIGKLKKADPETTKKALETINALEFEAFPEFTVEVISLYESFLSRNGSHYRIIGNSVLG